jgi:hypothetical protein
MKINRSIKRTFGHPVLEDESELRAMAMKYTKLHLVRELLESDRLLRADAAQINELGAEVRRLQGLLCGLTGNGGPQIDT